MAPNDKPRDKGLGEYAKDFVGGLLGRDDDDDQAAATQRDRAQSNANEPQQPHDKGIGEYTKDFVGGLFGRDDNDQASTQPKKDSNQSFVERVQEDARAAAERAQAQATSQAQQKQGGEGGGSIFDRVREAADDAAKNARETQQAAGAGTAAAPRSSFDQPAQPSASGNAAPRSSFDQPAQPSASGNDQGELERLRARVADLERQQSGSHPAAPAQQRTYVVKPGDSLSLIAKRFYGDPMQWKRIYETNRSKISNPDLIHPGQEFVIPE